MLTVFALFCLSGLVCATPRTGTGTQPQNTTDTGGSIIDVLSIIDWVQDSQLPVRAIERFSDCSATKNSGHFRALPQ
jgi:hypothetical protein